MFARRLLASRAQRAVLLRRSVHTERSGSGGSSGGSGSSGGGGSGGLSAHDRIIQREFKLQSAAYADKYNHADLQHTLGWIRDGMWSVLNPPAVTKRNPPMRVLDVCAGTGAFTRLLSPHVASITALDLTPQMIAESKKSLAAMHERQRAAGGSPVDNVTFVEANAQAMPFGDGEFDLVVSRFAVHHWEKPDRIFSEMARVTRRGGAMAIVDIVVPPHVSDADIALHTRLNDLERVRDPSHTHFLTLSALQSCFDRCGFERWPSVVTHERIVDCDEWLTTSHTPPAPAEQVRKVLRAEIAAGSSIAANAVTGFRPFYRNARVALPVTSSNVNTDAIKKTASATADGKRLSFWHSDVLVGGFKP